MHRVSHGVGMLVHSASVLALERAGGGAMWGSKLCLVLLTCVYPDPVAESWSLFGTANESECGVNATCEEGGVRGVFSRPGFIDSIAEKASTGQWGWMAKFAWRFIGEIFIQGIAWCGTLCNFVGIAAKNYRRPPPSIQRINFGGTARGESSTSVPSVSAVFEGGGL